MGTVTITTLGDLTSVGGRIQADGTLTLHAGGTVALLAQRTGSTKTGSDAGNGSKYYAIANFKGKK